jgi:hypothetical protein
MRRGVRELETDPGRIFRAYPAGEFVRLDVEADEGDQCTFRGPSCLRILVQTTMTVDQARTLVDVLEQAIANAAEPDDDEPSFVGGGT